MPDESLVLRVGAAKGVSKTGTLCHLRGILPRAIVFFT
jgi:hypothetical protein